MNTRRVAAPLGASERIDEGDFARSSPRVAIASGTAQFAESQPDHILGQTPTLLWGEYILPKQLAAELGISIRTLHRWHSARQGPPRVVLGRVVLYRRSSVLAWIETREERVNRRMGRRTI